MGKKVVIVGGVAGGATALARLRRLDESLEIVLFERGEYVSFANCGLPYYIGGGIENRESLLVQTPEKMQEKFNADVRINSEVIQILKEDKQVVVKNVKTGETYKETYDDLILSTGSTPLTPPIPGIKAPNIFSLWNVPDTDKIKAYVEDKKPKSVVIVGGGFIGIEMAENLHGLGLEVSIVEMLDQVMAPIDFGMAEIVHEHLRSQGVDLRLSDGVKSFENNENKTTVTLNSEKEIITDLVILSIGVRPNGELAKEAGLAVNPRGGVIVDKKLRTSDENIYAVGDMIEVEDFINKNQVMIPLAGPANKQARIVAGNILGDNKEYKGTQGSSIAKVFDLTVANTGANEKTLNNLGKVYKKDYDIALIHANSHADYYPGALPMTLKMIYNLDGKILGAQIVGYDGVDKRIDVLATAIRFKGTVNDLTELELAYAPPFTSAKDPVNMLGFVAENQMNGLIENVLPRDLVNLKDNEAFLDIMENEEREMTKGCIKESKHIPLGELRDRLDELDKDITYYTYCATGVRAYIATRILLANGFKAKNIAGGFKSYKTINCQTKDVNNNDSNTAEEKEKTVDTSKSSVENFQLDACGLSCPGPIIKVNEKLSTLNDGDVLEVFSSDPGFANDIKAWCRNTGNTLLKSEKQDKKYVALIEKGNKKVIKQNTELAEVKDGKNIIVFSGDLDKAIASFIIANGAKAMGKEVSMFFTFWGLNVIKKESHTKTKKDMMATMFSKMMPKSSKGLGLSKMNMGGMGSKMIRKVMNDKNISSLEELIQAGIDSGIKMIACQMSMDVMGVDASELLDGVEIGGVATMLDASDDSNMSLFI